MVQKAERLGEKLLHIRLTLGLSQTEMLKRLGFDEEIHLYENLGLRTGQTRSSLTAYSRVCPRCRHSCGGSHRRRTRPARKTSWQRQIPRSQK